ncbi:MAG: WecB/TagA/CpsF family glycosyltransferase [bacterium]|nr:WecB/TagA/CpsF family glycosyltransferase [bacterium]
MTSRSTFNCFGLVIHGYGWDEIKSRLIEFGLQKPRNEFQKQKPFWIVTANPEILHYSKQNPWYWEIIRHADLRTVDGFGLQTVGFLSGAQPKRITGVSLAESILQHAVKNNWTVGITGGRGESADRAVWNIRQRYPELKISIIPIGEITPLGNRVQDDQIQIHQIPKPVSCPDVVFVALGHPKQEAWIEKHLNDMQNSKIVMGVGGTIDFWSGTAKRAPKIFQILGLEWTWRLIIEPWRWKRIFNAVILFPYEILKEAIKKTTHR